LGACATPVGWVPAAPPANALPDLGPSAAAVRVDPARDAVQALVEGYLRALGARDLDTALQCLDDAVGGVAQPQPLPFGALGPAQLRARHEGLVTELSRLGNATVRVWSSEECQARGGCAPAHRPGDWYCDWETPSATARQVLPRSALVRVVDGRARIVALTDAFVSGRR